MQVPSPALSPVKITDFDMAVRTDTATDARENPSQPSPQGACRQKAFHALFNQLPLLPLLSSRVDPSECEVEVPTSGHCRPFNQLPSPPLLSSCVDPSECEVEMPTSGQCGPFVYLCVCFCRLLTKGSLTRDHKSAFTVFDPEDLLKFIPPV